MIKLKKEGEYLMGYNENNVACCYYPLNSEAKELDLPLLPNPFENDKGLEKSLNKYIKYLHSQEECIGFIDGYKAAQQSKQFNLENILKFRKVLEEGALTNMSCTSAIVEFDRFIQSLSIQQLPSEFIPDYEDYELLGQRDDDGYPLWSKKLKTITNSEGKQEIQGKFIW